MQISSPANSHELSSRPKAHFAAAVERPLYWLLLLLLLSTPAHAQTLARPGWAGSGLTPEPWWRHAVIYRLDDGKLPTLAQLPSLQAFGIDAVLLTPQAMQPAPDTAPAAEPVQEPEPPLSLDDFLFESSRLRIRVLVPLDVTAARTHYVALPKAVREGCPASEEKPQ